MELSLSEFYKENMNITNTNTNTMVNVTLTEPPRHNVYIVKYNFDSSPPEGDSAIFVKTGEDTGYIHSLALNVADAHLYHNRESIDARKVKETGENPSLIGTTPAENYPDSWDGALRDTLRDSWLVEENQQYETTSLALSNSTHAGMKRVKISRWTQECTRPALERAGLVEKIEMSSEGGRMMIYIEDCLTFEAHSFPFQHSSPQYHLTMEDRPTLTNPRFTLELEFVSSLANPYYLSHLAVTYPNLLGISRADDDDSTSPDAQAFATYLAYLYSYWKTPEYSQFLTHPGPTLRALRLLQEDNFRRDIILPQVIEGLAGVSVPEPAQTETDVADEKQDGQNGKT
ncbi:unnamed protein product [Penicillium glandicola]